MSQILNRIRDVDPNDSDAVKDAVTTFFQNLSKYTKIDSNRWLRALENVITRFPKYCSSHRNTIEHYLVHFLDSNNYYNVIEAAKCAHALQQVRPSQDKSATAKNCWREQMTILCDASHILIEAIFAKTVDIYKNPRKAKQHKAELLVNTPLTAALADILKVAKGDSAINRKTLLCTRLTNLFVFIQAMLVEIYPVAKPIQPQLILEVIVQALSVSSGVTSDVIDAAAVKTQALRTLDAMVACLGPNLIPFSALVFRFVMQTLRWSSDNPSEQSRQVRCAAYASLSGWLSTLHSHRIADGRGRSWEDELTNHIITDITPPKRVVELTMSSLPTKNLSKKARKKLANRMLMQSNIANHMPGEKNKIFVAEELKEEVASAALECAETFLTVCGIFLKPTTHKVFQERLVRECYGVEAQSPERGVRSLRALDACRKNAPPALPPPTQHCLQLYSLLLQSRSQEITRFCSQALLDIRLHLHCSPPSLSYALDAQPERTKASDNRKRISDKNRAVLELLLGKERMPSEAVDEEIITIPDEPLNKKPRLEDEVTDQIILSSESNNSVEISDDSDDEVNIIQEVDVVIENVQQNEPDQDEIDLEPIVDDENVESSNKDHDSTPITTENTDKIERADTITSNIFEAKTQLPLNASNDMEEGDNSPVSMEVAYDHPNVGNKVTVLEKMDDENLPSTNDTDDVQITCGQDIRSSQDLDNEKNKGNEEVPVVNGVDEVESAEKIVENGVVNVEIEVKAGVKEINVDDMLADFVDEVNDDNKTIA